MSHQEVIGFHNPDEENAILSNWYPCSFEADGSRYTSMEQYMMAQKAIVFGDESALRAIRATDDPAAIRVLGRSVRNYQRNVWNGRRQLIVTRGLLAKFRQNPPFREFLLATGDALLAECSAEDLIWGNGIAMTDERRFDPEQWTGQNLMGYSLMEVREELRREPACAETIRDLARRSRSVRGYREERRLSEAELRDLVDCARLCPSSVNRQPLRYRLAWEPEEVAAIQPLTGWAKALPNLTLPHPHMTPTAFIVICQDTHIDPSLTRFQKDVGIVAQTMLLAAAQRGLGGCMIGSFRAGSLREVLHLPEFLVPMLVVALGEPAETIVLTEIDEGESTDYYRDENDVHYVPKRKLDDIIIRKT